MLWNYPNLLSADACALAAWAQGYAYISLQNGSICSGVSAGHMAANQAAQPSELCQAYCASGSGTCGGPCVNEYFSIAATPPSTAAVASGPFTDVGCWQDCGDTGLPSGRTLPYYFGYSNGMTVGLCVQMVRNLGLSYAALQDGDECRGGNNYTLATILGRGGDCSRACYGNASDTCASCAPLR